MANNIIMDIEQESSLEEYIKEDIANQQYSERFCFLTPAKWKEDRFTKLAFLPLKRCETNILRGNLYLTAEYSWSNTTPVFQQLFAEFKSDDHQRILVRFDSNKRPPTKEDILERITETYILSNFPEKINKELEQLGFTFETLKHEACLVNRCILHFYDQIDICGKNKTDEISILIRVNIGEQLSNANIDSISAYYCPTEQTVINRDYVASNHSLPTRSKIVREIIGLAEARKLVDNISKLHVASRQIRRP